MCKSSGKMKGSDGLNRSLKPRLTQCVHFKCVSKMLSLLNIFFEIKHPFCEIGKCLTFTSDSLLIIVEYKMTKSSFLFSWNYQLHIHLKWREIIKILNTENAPCVCLKKKKRLLIEVTTYPLNSAIIRFSLSAMSHSEKQAGPGCVLCGLLRNELTAVYCVSPWLLRDSCLRASLGTAAVWSNCIHMNLSSANFDVFVYSFAREWRSGLSHIFSVLCICLTMPMCCSFFGHAN